MIHTLHVIVSLVSVMCGPHNWTPWGHHFGGYFGIDLVDGARTVVGPLISLCIVFAYKFSGPLVVLLVVLIVVLLLALQFDIGFHTL